MKRTILIFLCLGLCTSAFAQSYPRNDSRSDLGDKVILTIVAVIAAKTFDMIKEEMNKPRPPSNYDKREIERLLQQQKKGNKFY